MIAAAVDTTCGALSGVVVVGLGEYIAARLDGCYGGSSAGS